MTYSSSALPPPAVFLHQETLHAIPLPPLASWLISLRKPEHLVRLNDLLQRYKTPQSYHRIDVRLIESSELPPGSPDSQVEELEEDRKVRKGSRDIVELDEGNTLERYWSSKHGQDQFTETADRSQKANGDGDESRTDKIDDVESGSRQNITSQPHTETLKEQERSDTEVNTKTPSLSQTEEALKALQLPPPPSDPPQSPIPTYPLPPIGPTRKVRELRLDLRTLDAAALFALETWRREELGLEKLNMEFPDSVWYKDPTPTPSPPPRSIYTSTGKKKGRPRKHRTPIVVDPEDETTETGLGLQVGEVNEEVQNGMMTEEQAKGYETPVNTLQVNREGDENVGPDEGTRTAIKVPDILETFGGLAQKDEEVEKEDVLPAAMDDGAVRPREDDQNNSEPVPVDGVDHPQPPVETEAGPSRTTPLSPSPDILLNDIFNEKEDDDPDFIPPPSPPARRPRPRRNRKSQVDEHEEEGEKGTVTFDMGVIELPQPEGRTKSPQVIVDKTSESRSKSSSRSKSVSVEVEMLPEIPTAILDQEKVQAHRSPSIELLPNQPELQKSTKRPRRSNTMSVSIPHRSPKKARISNDPPAMITKTSSIAKARARARFVVEIPSKKAVSPDSEDEEEEWGFLRSFG
ncbi:hypothetical protein V865_000811 [Kwoniella europaea PYCC6329]|uniref:Uncharacterized protein n=1 Tax=Kwoniella europaea PYCC6329 TaxID=1423913 RepID=A0AAX4K970_9TREE